MKLLIAPKSVHEFEPDEYYTYVSEQYALRTKGRAKPVSPAPGLTVNRTKAGKLSVRRSKVRTFEYVTWTEIEKLAAAVKCSQSELWQVLKAKNYIIAKDRMEAEKIHAQQQGVEL